MQQLSEIKLSRVWQHFTDPERNVALLTAFRGSYTREENLIRNKSLIADIRNLGYGLVIVDGAWIENQGTEHEKHVSEDSILVIGSKYKDDEFADTIHKLGNNFDQDAVIVKDHRGTRLIFNNGSEQEFTSMKPGKLASVYTKLRPSEKNSTFVFEGEREDLGFLQRLAGIRSK